MRHVAFICGVGLLLIGCSSDDEPAVVTGTVDGAAFTAKSAIAVAYPVDTCSDGPLLLLSIGFGESFDTTDVEQHNCELKAGSRGFNIDIWKYVSSGQIGPGTYATRDDASGGQVIFQSRFDDTCAQQFPNLLSSAGTVILDTVDSTHVVGSLDVKFPTGGSLRGRFDAPVLQPDYGACKAFGKSGGSDLSVCAQTVCVP
jgi:hypothetical protein